MDDCNSFNIACRYKEDAMVDVICGFNLDLMKDCSSFQKISKVGTHEFCPFQSGWQGNLGE
jgi:hypothetical protein